MLVCENDKFKGILRRCLKIGHWNEEKGKVLFCMIDYSIFDHKFMMFCML